MATVDNDDESGADGANGVKDGKLGCAIAVIAAVITANHTKVTLRSVMVVVIRKLVDFMTRTLAKTKMSDSGGS